MSEPNEMSIAEACAVTEQFGRFVKGMSRLQETATLLRSADQLLSERRRDEKASLERTEELKKEISELGVERDGMRAACEAEKLHVQRAAREITAAAQTEAQKILDAARAQESEHRTNAAGVIARADAAERRVAQAKSELAEIEARIAQARTEARKILGS